MARASDPDPAVVAAVACAVLEDEQAVATSWTVDHLSGGAGNPTTAGLARLSGTADVAGAELTWSVVRKQLRLPAEYPEMAGPRHPLYWRRELEVYRSGLLDALPGGLVAPRCLRTDELPDGQVWLWLEDLGPMPPKWPVAARRSALQHLARFHAAYLLDDPIPGYPWMTLCFARQWYDLLIEQAAPAVAAVRGSSRQLAPLVSILDEPGDLFSVLESAPQTLCHHDPNIDNLLVRSTTSGGSELQVIDWQLVGRGPIGEDIGQFLATLLAEAERAARDRLESESLAVYHGALVGAGVRVSLADVHRGYYCAAALRQGVFAFYLLGEQLAAATTTDSSRSAIDDFVRRTRHSHLPALASRARALAGD
jgi:hypothetical protein